ncbi:UNVERIFIED_CONTAM: Subtilisin inhibitor CLSI-I [Sesamum angustifolium]|uniref:Subtilisin inhibitor CLSI-I n=1 Tax=Sesamum angustifolium TaxID=2727405 RepID=A0AAW2N5Q7_9LAMI
MAEKESQPLEVHQEPIPELSPAPHEAAGKSRWAEVVGLTAEEAERKIKEEMPAGTHIYALPSDSYVTMDFRTDRVRIFTDSSGKVSTPPRIG